ncbi:MAG: SCP2 sterol-binding domain-containing protein [Chitinophagales bacterium]
MNTPTTAKEIILSLSDRFKTASVDEDLEIIFHFEISGDRGGDFTVHIKDAKCTVSKGLHGEPKCEIKVSDSNYEEIELGKTNAQMAFMMGKIKISNIGAMLKFVENFERLH